MFHRVNTLFLVSLLLTACAVGPDYVRPPVPTQETWKADGIEWKNKDSIQGAAIGTWWDHFEDPLLSTHLSNVRMGAYDVRVAYRRITQSAGLLRRERSFFYPSVSIAPSYTRQRFSDTEAFFSSFLIDNYQIPLSLSYELDVWGKIRRSVESAEAAKEAATADFEAVLLGVTSQGATLYFALQAVEKELEILERTRETRNENLRLVQARVDTGTSDELDLSRAQSELGVVEADLEVIKAIKDRTLNAMAVLEGQTPASFDISVSPLPCDPPSVPEILPSDLLSGRPDVVAAEELAKAASAAIGVAKSVFFPSFNLNALFGTSTQNSDQVFDSESRFWSLSPGFTLPIFQGGRNLANLDIAEQAYLEAVENYKRTVLNAIREVEDAIVNVRQLERQSEKLEESVKAAFRTTELSRSRYLEGLVSYFDVVDAERQALDLERSLNVACGQRYTASVELIRALGGGYRKQSSEIS